MRKKSDAKKAKKISKGFTKEWIEFTLCDLVDDVISRVDCGENPNKIMKKVIKKYAHEIFVAQN